MRIVAQRVSEASVHTGGDLVGRVGRGYVVLVGVGQGDDPETARRLAAKLARLRIFADDAGKTNLSVLDVAGEALVVSQFTLYADTRKGRRPSFTAAAPPGQAEDLGEIFRAALEDEGVPTQAGRFGADMQVSLVNDGPFTIVIDSEAD